MTNPFALDFVTFNNNDNNNNNNNNNINYQVFLSKVANLEIFLLLTFSRTPKLPQWTQNDISPKSHTIQP